MKDQVDQLKANGVAAECVNSTLAREELIAIYNRMHAGSSSCCMCRQSGY